MIATCLYCKSKYEQNPNSEYQTKWERCPECEKELNNQLDCLVKIIVSVPVEVRQKIWNELNTDEVSHD